MKLTLHALVALQLMLLGSLASAAPAGSEEVVYYTQLDQPLPWLLSASCASDDGGSTVTSALALDVRTGGNIAPWRADLTIRTRVCVKFMGAQSNALSFPNFPLKNILALPLGKQGWLKLTDAEIASLNSALNASVNCILIITHDLNPGSSQQKFTLHLNDVSGGEVASISLFLNSGAYHVPVAGGSAGVPRTTDGLWPISHVEANAMGEDINGTVTALFHYRSN